MVWVIYARSKKFQVILSSFFLVLKGPPKKRVIEGRGSLRGGVDLRDVGGGWVVGDTVLSLSHLCTGAEMHVSRSRGHHLWMRRYETPSLLAGRSTPYV